MIIWTVMDVYNWLLTVCDGELQSVALIFKQNNIDGATLIVLTQEDFKTFVPDERLRRRILLLRHAQLKLDDSNRDPGIDTTEDWGGYRYETSFTDEEDIDLDLIIYGYLRDVMHAKINYYHIVSIIMEYNTPWLKKGDKWDIRDGDGKWVLRKINYYKKAGKSMPRRAILTADQNENIKELEKLEAIYIGYPSNEWIFIEADNSTICDCDGICRAKNTIHRIAPAYTHSEYMFSRLRENYYNNYGRGYYNDVKKEEDDEENENKEDDLDTEHMDSSDHRGPYLVTLKVDSLNYDKQNDRYTISLNNCVLSNENNDGKQYIKFDIMDTSKIINISKTGSICEDQIEIIDETINDGKNDGEHYQ